MNDGFKNAGDIVPNIAGLACYLGVGHSTIYEYKDQDKDFSDTLDGIQVTQERMLINGGLLG